MAGSRGIVVVAGPPCSGKSTLAREISRKTGLIHLEMDTVRRRLLPDADHGKRNRDIAYRAMHLTAETVLRSGGAVIADATYGPARHRKEIEEICRRTAAKLYLVECSVSAEVAAARYAARAGSHPASDLDAERVRDLANAYPFFGAGLELDAAFATEERLERALAYLREENPVDAGGRWSEVARGRW